MLDTYGCSCILRALGVLHCKSCSQIGILREILVCTATYGQTLDIDGRTKNHIFATKTALYAHSVTILVCKFRGPGGSQGRTCGEISGGVIGPTKRTEAVTQFLPDSERTISIFDVLYAQSWNAFR